MAGDVLLYSATDHIEHLRWASSCNPGRTETIVEFAAPGDLLKSPSLTTVGRLKP